MKIDFYILFKYLFVFYLMISKTNKLNEIYEFELDIKKKEKELNDLIFDYDLNKLKLKVLQKYSYEEEITEVPDDFKIEVPNFNDNKQVSKKKIKELKKIIKNCLKICDNTFFETNKFLKEIDKIIIKSNQLYKNIHK